MTGELWILGLKKEGLLISSVLCLFCICTKLTSSMFSCRLAYGQGSFPKLPPVEKGQVRTSWLCVKTSATLRQIISLPVLSQNFRLSENSDVTYPVSQKRTGSASFPRSQSVALTAGVSFSLFPGAPSTTEKINHVHLCKSVSALWR